MLLSLLLLLGGQEPPHATRLFRDLDGDGRLDLYRAVEGAPDRLLAGAPAGFVDRTSELGLDGLASRRVLAADLDGDGALDLVLVGSDGLLRLLLGGRGGFRPAPERLPELGTVEDATLLRGAGGSATLLLCAPSGSRLALSWSGGTFVPLGPSTEPSAAERGAPPMPPGSVEVLGEPEGPTCVDGIADQAAAPCLEAASVPALGRLRPLSSDLNVDAEGEVGLGTTTQSDRLVVEGPGAFRGASPAAAATGTAQGDASTGYLGVLGTSDYGGDPTADWAGLEIGLAAVAVDGVPTRNVGVLGHGRGVGVRGEHASDPSGTWGELGRQGRGVVADGPSFAAELLGDVAVRDGSLEVFDAGGSDTIVLEPNASGGGGELTMEDEAGTRSVLLEANGVGTDTGRLTFGGPTTQRLFLSGGGTSGAGVLSMNSATPVATVQVLGDFLEDGSLYVTTGEGIDEESVWFLHNLESGRIGLQDEADDADVNGVGLFARDGGFNGNLHVAGETGLGIVFEGEAFGGAEVRLHEEDGTFALLVRDDDLTLYDSPGFATVNFDRQTGTKSAVVDAGAHGRRLLYAIEAPELWFEDLGSGRLERGRGRVDLDPAFLATVTIDADHPLLVQVTPGGPARGLWVEVGTGGFVVHDTGGGDASFHWRAVAKRRGLEEVRFAPEVEGGERGLREGLDPDTGAPARRGEPAQETGPEPDPRQGTGRERGTRAAGEEPGVPGTAFVAGPGARR